MTITWRLSARTSHVKIGLPLGASAVIIAPPKGESTDTSHLNTKCFTSMLTYKQAFTSASPNPRFTGITGRTIHSNLQLLPVCNKVVSHLRTKRPVNVSARMDLNCTVSYQEGGWGGGGMPQNPQGIQWGRALPNTADGQTANPSACSSPARKRNHSEITIQGLACGCDGKPQRATPSYVC